MLRGEDPAGGIKRESFAVAQAARKSLGWREVLVGLVGVIAPDTGASRLLGAEIVAGRMGESVLRLVIVGGPATWTPYDVRRWRSAGRRVR
jgi:hypothetical protein